MRTLVVFAGILMFIWLCIPEDGAYAFELKSSAFKNGGYIPRRHTCLGGNVSPPLSWSGLPEGTQGLALICEDVDAPSGSFTHWIIFNIPGTVSSLPEGLAPSGVVQEDMRQGINGFGQIGYRGPCPPPGKPHRYFFRLYALNTYFLLPPGCSKEELVQMMGGNILGTVELVGLFKQEVAKD